MKRMKVAWKHMIKIPSGMFRVMQLKLKLKIVHIVEDGEEWQSTGNNNDNDSKDKRSERNRHQR